jgi:putative oxidoreductase
MDVRNSVVTNRADIGLAILRLVIGTVFIAHGAQKLFVFGLDGVADAFGGLGLPLAGLLGPAVAFAEFVGGIALVVGLFARVSGAVLAGTMLGAVTVVHLQAGFFLPNGYEFALAMLGGAAAISLTGPGSFSAEAIIARRRNARTSYGRPS